MRPDDLDALKGDLLSFRSAFEDAVLRAQLVENALPRLLATLDLIPDSLAGGNMLELGANPYFLSLCLQRLCSGRVTRANYFGTNDRRGSERLVHAKDGREVEFAYDVFNIETDEFPYPDEHFDVVIFSELIEHLAINPVRALSEIHRVLKQDGVLIVTTPNALSLLRLEYYLLGGSAMVDRFSPAFGYGARHNREYHPRELRALLEGTGFRIEEMVVRDLAPPSTWRQRLNRAVWRRVLPFFSNDPREEHIFLRARRTGRFRWYFPPSLFDNIELYVLVRYPYVEMGINDAIQCATGWYPLENWDGDGCVRWVRHQAKAYLRAMEGATSLAFELFTNSGAAGEQLDFRVAARDRAGHHYVDTGCRVERGSWRTIEFPLQGQRQPGDELELTIDVDPGGGPSRALARLSERERGAAVRRIWLRS